MKPIQKLKGFKMQKIFAINVIKVTMTMCYLYVIDATQNVVILIVILLHWNLYLLEIGIANFAIQINKKSKIKKKK